MTESNRTNVSLQTLTRRSVLAAGAGAAASLGVPALAQSSSTIKIGYITALSGVRANFGEAD